MLAFVFFIYFTKYEVLRILIAQPLSRVARLAQVPLSGGVVLMACQGDESVRRSRVGPARHDSGADRPGAQRTRRDRVRAHVAAAEADHRRGLSAPGRHRRGHWRRCQ